MSYCIAFSIDGATDVTRRYVRNPTAHGAVRDRAPEEVLMWILNEIKGIKRDGLSKQEKSRLIKEDQREERELRSYVVQSLATEIERIIPTGPNGQTVGSSSGTSRGSEPKLPGRQSGPTAWRRARGENGPSPGEPGSDQPPREGH